MTEPSKLLKPEQQETLLVLSLALEPLVDAVRALCSAVDDLADMLNGVPTPNDVSALINDLILEPDEAEATDPWDGTKNEVRYAGILRQRGTAR